MCMYEVTYEIVSGSEDICFATTGASTYIRTPSTNIMPTPIDATCQPALTARSYCLAPKFCPTMAETARLSANIGMKVKASTRKPIVHDANAAVAFGQCFKMKKRA